MVGDDEDTPIARVVVGEHLAPRDNLGAVYQQAKQTVERFDEVTFLTLASMTRIAERIESALGLESPLGD